MASPTKYQEVVTATNYALTAEDGTPFPVFLRFDGTDDSMATGNIDFTATDKMSVFAGVRKLSDAARGVVAELGGNQENSFVFDASVTTGGSFGPYYRTFSRGALVFSDTLSATGNGYAAPITNVVASSFSISGDSTILRIDGTQVASSTADQGTGKYGNYPLYIGRRGGTTLPFNGRLYSLVVCGKLASAAEIASTEAYINQKTRAY